jgi:EPS-associated MarR family transcriptional regulator
VQGHGGSVLKALYRPAICPFGKPPSYLVPAATAPTHSPRITRLQEEMRFKVLRALAEKGLLKARNFRNSQNKLAYAYLLTPSGMAQKAELTRGYLERKTAEFEALKDEIERLQADLSEQLWPFSSPAAPA